MLLIALLAALSALPAPRAVRWDDLRPAMRELLESLGVGGAGFERFRLSVERSTAERLAEGENDHLVFFVLQSSSFTRAPRIEPALSAKGFVESGATSAPVDAARRIDDFLVALKRPSADERMRYFQRRGGIPRELLEAEYARAMRFVYRKEFGGGPPAEWYRARGHSTDTRPEASYAVWNALAVLHSLDARARFSRVLVAGPGLDFAPRTALVDDIPPQSYQPFLLADALAELRLAREDWRIDCADINPRVVEYFAARPRKLTMFREAQDEEYSRYFEQAGSSIGTIKGNGPRKLIELDPDVARRITASRLNIIAERYDVPPGYDLVVATNILVYFSPTELALAAANLRSMMRDGGYLIHNELRGEFDAVAQAAGFEAVQARSVRLSPDLYDAFAIYRADASSRSSKSSR